MRSGRPRWNISMIFAVLIALVGPLGVASAEDLSTTAAAAIDDSELGWDDTSTMRGRGWAPGKRLEIILYAGGHVLAEPVVQADGSFTTTVRVPKDIASSNAYVIAVQGPGGDGVYGYVEVPVTIIGPTPSISIASDQLAWDEVTTVTGERYEAGAEITISLFPDNIVLATLVADDTDSFRTQIRIPSGLLSANYYKIAVAGQGIDKLFHFDALDVTIIGDRPVVSLGAERVERGATLPVSGLRFAAGTEATVTLLPGYEELAVVPIEPDGTFATDTTIPLDAAGSAAHAIVVTGQASDGQFAYVTAEVVLAPASVSPVTLQTPTTASPPDLGADEDRDDAAAPIIAERSDGSGGWSWILVVLVVGALLLVLLLASRRRRRWLQHRFRRLTELVGTRAA